MLYIKDRLKCMKRWTNALRIVNFVIQVWGFMVVWSDPNAEIIQQKQSEGYRQWWLIANFMLSIRVMVYAVMLLTLLIFACLFLFQRERQVFEEQAHISRIEARLPKVKEILN